MTTAKMQVIVNLVSQSRRVCVETGDWSDAAAESLQSRRSARSQVLWFTVHRQLQC